MPWRWGSVGSVAPVPALDQRVSSNSPTYLMPGENLALDVDVAQAHEGLLHSLSDREICCGPIVPIWDRASWDEVMWSNTSERSADGFSGASRERRFSAIEQKRP